MHPSNYDLAIQHARMEVERAAHRSTMRAEALPIPTRDEDRPSRIDALLQWLARFAFPARSQQATAD